MPGHKPDPDGRMAEIYLRRGQSALVHRAPQPANPTFTERLGEDQFLWISCSGSQGGQPRTPRTVFLERGQSVLVSHAVPTEPIPTVERQLSPQRMIEIEIGGSGG